MKLNGRCLLTVSAFALFSTLGASSGWEAFIEVDSISDSEYEDVMGGASVETTQFTVGASGFWRGQGGQFAWDSAYSRLGAEWKDVSFAPDLVGDLYDEVENVSASFLWTGLPHEKWGYSVFLGFDSAHAGQSPFQTVDFTDALALQTGFSVNYQSRRDLVIGFGFAYLGAPAEIDETWIPIVRIYWQINEEWLLQTRNGVLLSWDPGADRAHVLTFSALWQSPQWHLGETGPVEYGYEEEAIALGLAYQWNIRPGLVLQPEIHYLVNREATLWEDGEEIIETDLESALLYSIGLRYSF